MKPIIFPYRIAGIMLLLLVSKEHRVGVDVELVNDKIEQDTYINFYTEVKKLY